MTYEKVVFAVLEDEVYGLVVHDDLAKSADVFVVDLAHQLPGRRSALDVRRGRCSGLP